MQSSLSLLQHDSCMFLFGEACLSLYQRVLHCFSQTGEIRITGQGMTKHSSQWCTCNKSMLKICFLKVAFIWYLLWISGTLYMYVSHFMVQKSQRIDFLACWRIDMVTRWFQLNTCQGELAGTLSNQPESGPEDEIILLVPLVAATSCHMALTFWSWLFQLLSLFCSYHCKPFICCSTASHSSIIELCNDELYLAPPNFGRWSSQYTGDNCHCIAHF